MGAECFQHKASGDSAEEAFRAAREEAFYECGHSGYTGTIAEKTEFTIIELPAGKDAEDYAEELIDEGDTRIQYKWGPCGCIAMGNRRYVFFGWASS